MDLASLIGLIAGTLIIAAAILLGSGVGLFINLPGLLIVFGGAASATLIRFPLKDCGSAIKTGFARVFKEQTDDPAALIQLARHLADVGRKKGLIALENEPVDNPLFSKGIQLCVDGHDGEFIQELLGKEISLSIERNEMGERIFRAMGDAAPAFGMIGTLVGLVQMLSNLSDPASIGPAMAVALLTTLYGALLANLLFLPLADKLQTRAGLERVSKALILESVSGIQNGANPRTLGELLETYLPESRRGQEAPGGGIDLDSAAADTGP